jgi:hypothetical protein
LYNETTHTEPDFNLYPVSVIYPDPVIVSGEIDVRLGELTSSINEKVQLIAGLQSLSTINLELTKTIKS